MNIDYNTATTAFTTAFGSSPSTAVTLTGDLLKETGLDTKNVTTVTAKLTPATGKICVTIEQIPTSSEYYSTEYWGTDGKPKSGAATKNTNC